VEIAIKAERLIASRPDAGPLLAHPQLLVRILEDGSWCERRLDAAAMDEAAGCARALSMDRIIRTWSTLTRLASFHQSNFASLPLRALDRRSSHRGLGDSLTSLRVQTEDLVAITNKQNLLSIDRISPICRSVD